MFEKTLPLVGTVMLGGALLIGCGTVEDDDESPTIDPNASPTAEPDAPTPPAVSIDSNSPWVDCDGTDSTSIWYFELETSGWASEAFVDIYDDPTGYSDTSDLWIESHALFNDATSEIGDPTWTQVWMRDDLTWVETWQEQNADPDGSILFDCQFKDGMTYVFWAYDYIDSTYSSCVAVGGHTDMYNCDL